MATANVGAPQGSFLSLLIVIKTRWLDFVSKSRHSYRKAEIIHAHAKFEVF